MIGAALGWKYNHAPGIRTDGDVLTGWPESLGPRPTDAEVAAIVAEYRAALPDIAKQAEAERISDIIELIADVTGKPLAVVKAAYLARR